MKWIRNKQRLWREYRDKEGIDKEMEKDLMRSLLEKVTERENKLGLSWAKLSPSGDLKLEFEVEV